MESIRCFNVEIKAKMRKSLTFYTGVKFSKWSDFNENGLKLIGLSCRFKKCIVCHEYNVPI